MNWKKERIVRIQTQKPRQGRAFKVCTSVFVFFLPAVAASAQTNSAPAGKDNSIYAELAKAPRKAATRPNPLASDPDAVAAGRKLFDRHCAECHGQMAQGGKKGPSLRADEVQQASPGSLFWLLTNGVVRRGMPVWSKLPEPQRWQLVSFVKSLRPTAPASLGGEKTPQP